MLTGMLFYPGGIMLRKPSVFLVVTLAIVSGMAIVSLAQPQSLLTRHTRDAVISGRAPLVGHLPATQSMRLVLVLPLRNQAGLENLLHEVHDPSSPSYRKFLTLEQFTEMFGPSQRDYDSVIRFAEANGLTVVGTSPNRMNLDVRGSVANIEKALHVTLGLYQQLSENRTFFAIDREPMPNLPVQLWHIAGLDNYSVPKPALLRRDANSPNLKSNASTGSGPDESFLGSDMRAAYYENTTLTGSGQSLGLLEYAGTDLTDLDTYYANVGQTNNVPITLLSTDGTPTSCTEKQGCDDTEQTIDMTQSLGMAPGMSSLVMYVGSTDVAIFNAMATAKPLNAQLSSSWVWGPADPNTLNPYFEEFALQGQNFFQAAGDSGKWGTHSGVWPADSVYVTSVGGTDLTTTGPGGGWQSETAWSDGGGGISPDGFAIPSWQVTTAEGCSRCSQTLRNAPDVAANANFSFYVCADQTACSANVYGGTSFAAPMWAGYLALANEQLISNGSTSTLGFVNPIFYQIGLSSSYDIDFHDINTGSNGFPATSGYDLATGWGSPNGDNLINALAVVSAGFTLSASPGSLSVLQGASGTSTITSAVTGGFDSAVSLSATGQPTGVTITFSPSTITGSGTSTMTIAVGSTTAPGAYSITVTGTSGSIAETTTVNLTVTAPASNFTIAASPKSLGLNLGQSGSVKITTTVSGGFDSAVALSASVTGSHITVTFNPATIPAPGSGHSLMTVSADTGATQGRHTITITGTGGGLTHTTTVTLQVEN
jgi:subtilase family serine protease